MRTGGGRIDLLASYGRAIDMDISMEDLDFTQPTAPATPSFLDREFARAQTRVAERPHGTDWKNTVRDWWNSLGIGDRETMIDLYRQSEDYARCAALFEFAMKRGNVPLVAMKWAMDECQRASNR